MIYILVKHDDIYVNKAMYNQKLALTEYMIEITKEQFETIKLPCKYIDGKFISCEMPIFEEETAPATDVEQLQADVDMLKIEMGLF